MSAVAESKEIELISTWFVRNYYELQSDAKDVPLELKQLITYFSEKMFDSKILSFKRDTDLLKLLNTTLSFKSSSLLFRASENDYLASKFHQMCDGKAPTITIIKSHWGNIFGGYTCIPWSSDRGLVIDKGDSFIFLIHSKRPIANHDLPKIWNYKDKGQFDQEVFHSASQGPSFGGGSDIKIMNRCNGLSSSISYIYPYNYLDDIDRISFCGGTMSRQSGGFFVDEYEVFQLVID